MIESFFYENFKGEGRGGRKKKKRFWKENENYSSLQIMLACSATRNKLGETNNTGGGRNERYIYSCWQRREGGGKGKKKGKGGGDK